MDDDDDATGGARRASRLPSLVDFLSPLWTENLWDPNSSYAQQGGATFVGSNGAGTLTLLPGAGRRLGPALRGLGGVRFGGGLPVAVSPMPQPPPPEESPEVEFLGRVSNGVQEGADSARDAEPGKKMEAFMPASLTGFLTAGLTAPLMKRLGVDVNPVVDWSDFIRKKLSEEGTQGLVNETADSMMRVIKSLAPQRSLTTRTAHPVVSAPASAPAPLTEEELGWQSSPSKERLALEWGYKQLKESQANFEAVKKTGAYDSQAYAERLYKVQGDLAYIKDAQARSDAALAQADRTRRLEDFHRRRALEAQTQGRPAQIPQKPPLKPSPISSLPDYDHLWGPKPGARTAEDVRTLMAAPSRLRSQAF